MKGKVSGKALPRVVMKERCQERWCYQRMIMKGKVSGKVLPEGGYKGKGFGKVLADAVMKGKLLVFI